MSTFMKIHLLVCAVVALLLPLIILTTKIRHSKKGILITLIAAVLICTCHFVYPVENCVYGFPSAQSAWEYYSTDEYVGCVDSNDSSLVVYKNADGTLGYRALGMDYFGYKVPIAFGSTLVKTVTFESGYYELLHAANVTDGYAVVTTSLTGQVTGPEAMLVVPTDQGTMIYLALESVTTPCTITVGGAVIEINEVTE